MRSPTKTKDTLSKVLPLRWSFGSKDRPKPSSPRRGELVEYLESGRRPRCTKDPIITLVATPPQGGHRDLGSSPSGSSLSCMDRTNSEACNSPRVPEGQSRPAVERSSSLGLSIITKARDDSSLGRRSSKRFRQDQGRTLDPHPHRCSTDGVHISHSAPPSRDSTLKRPKAQAGLTSRVGVLQAGLQPEERKGMRGQEVRSHDSLLSFFKSGFLKKDAQSTPSKGEEVRANGHGRASKVANDSSSKLSLSNGTLNGVALEEKRANGAPRGDCRHSKGQLVNGRTESNSSAADIKRAHSSSNIQTKLDLTLRRCASLQRNGQVAPPAPRSSLATDKPSYATLQRARYSTTSLGRQQRPVPESCF